MNPAIILIVLISYLIAFLAALIIFRQPTFAYAPATDPVQVDTVRQFDCWKDENGQITGCRVVEGRG